MKAIKWSTLRDYDDWKDTLQAILDEAATASRDNDDDARLDLCDVLNEFIRRSAPNTDDVKELDRVAGDAIDAMADTIAAAAVGRIAQRTATLTALGKRVDRVARQAEEAAAALRLERFHSAIDALVDAERAIASLDDAFVSGDDDALKQQVADLLRAVAKARAALERNQ